MYYNVPRFYLHKPIIRLFLAAYQLQDVEEYVSILNTINKKLVKEFKNIEEKDGKKIYSDENHDDIIYYSNGLCEFLEHINFSIVLPSWESSYFEIEAPSIYEENQKKLEEKAKLIEENQKKLEKTKKRAKQREQYKAKGEIHYNILRKIGNIQYAQFKIFLNKGYVPNKNQIVKLNDIDKFSLVSNLLSSEELELLKMNERFIEKLVAITNNFINLFNVKGIEWKNETVVKFFTKDELNQLKEFFNLSRGNLEGATFYGLKDLMSNFSKNLDRPKIVINHKEAFEKIRYNDHYYHTDTILKPNFIKDFYDQVSLINDPYILTAFNKHGILLKGENIQDA